MKNSHPIPLRLVAAIALAAGLAAGSAWANDPQHKDDAAHKAMDHDKADNMHTMPATVDAIDTNTGVVDVTSSGMKLKVHFPTASLSTLKVGDQITLHLGYSKQ